MKRISRLVLLGALALLAAPTAANAQVSSSGITHLYNSPKAGITNSDLAFWGNTVVVGNYSGFRLFDITNPTAPTLITDFTCTAAAGTAGQGDVSIWQNLVFRSVDTPQTTPGCTRRATTGSGATQTPGWEGVEIFDISTPTAPRQIAAVATDCGSHTHTLVPDVGNNRVLIYVSSYPAAAVTSTPTPYGNVCERGDILPGREHDKISIIEVPLNAPQTARVIAEPTYNFAGPGFTGVPGFLGCHDITVHMTLKIAAGACLTEGVIFDITNPAAPTIRQRLVNPAIDSCARAVPNPPVEPLCLWHSSTFTLDGKYMVFGDEDGGGVTAECSSEDPATDGAFWIHRLAAPTSPLIHFKIPRVQPAPAQNCTAHIMNFIPINGRYWLASSWYHGGTSVINWTNPMAPAEVAWYEIEPATAGQTVTNTWTTYWYNDYIHANDIARGYDVFRLEQAWRSQAWNMRRFNPQTQEDLVTCTVRAAGPRLRVGRTAHLVISVRTRNGVALIGGQPITQAQVTFRGAGITRTARTNGAGMVHAFRVRPTRRGTLRIAVQNDENLIGCRTQRVVAAAAAAGAGGRLTGSR